MNSFHIFGLIGKYISTAVKTTEEQKTVAEITDDELDCEDRYTESFTGHIKFFNSVVKNPAYKTSSELPKLRSATLDYTQSYASISLTCEGSEALCGTSSHHNSEWDVVAKKEEELLKLQKSFR